MAEGADWYEDGDGVGVEDADGAEDAESLEGSDGFDGMNESHAGVPGFREFALSASLIAVLLCLACIFP